MSSRATAALALMSSAWAASDSTTDRELPAPTSRLTPSSPMNEARLRPPAVVLGSSWSGDRAPRASSCVSADALPRRSTWTPARSVYVSESTVTVMNLGPVPAWPSSGDARFSLGCLYCTYSESMRRTCSTRRDTPIAFTWQGLSAAVHSAGMVTTGGMDTTSRNLAASSWPISVSTACASVVGSSTPGPSRVACLPVDSSSSSSAPGTHEHQWLRSLNEEGA
mmetsp:Transcript_27762/g.89396  ORF Transcript_27762/g.89396 Transcript_27762/m.89396 type:complete len:223 (-) Transcript_27762:471-1139(-)